MKELLDDIKERQDSIKDNLVFYNEGLSVWTKTPSDKQLSKGCMSCKEGKWRCLWVGHRCNLKCHYCVTDQTKNNTPDKDGYMQWDNIDEIKNSILTKPYDGVSYSGGEPFMYIDKILELSQFINENKPEVYQWIYTNGLMVNKEDLQKLYDSNIREIRFHIGAANYHDKVMENIKLATEIMDIVNIETPTTPKLKEFLIDEKNIHKFEEWGIHQMNLTEIFIFNDRAEKYFKNDDKYLYSSGNNIRLNSPKFRDIVYDIMDYTIENDIDILINDCSNEAKEAQAVTKAEFDKIYK